MSVADESSAARGAGPGFASMPDGTAWHPPAAGDHWGHALGLEVLEVTPERVVARVMADERHHQPYGVLHGGVYCSIVEAVASYGAGYASMASSGRGVLGVSNQTEFLRSHSRGRLDCIGEPLHIGRSAQLWEVRITRASDGKLVSRGQVRFHLLEQLPSERRAGQRW